MVGFKKRKLLLAMAGLFLLLLLLRMRHVGPLWALLGNLCHAPPAYFRQQLQLVRSACTRLPRDNLYSVSHGTLHRNPQAPSSARCYLWPSGVELSAGITPIVENLVNLRCRVSLHPEQEEQELREEKEEQSALIMPVIPRNFVPLGAPPGNAWNVVVLGLGGLSRRVLAKELTRSMELLSKGFKNAIVSRLVPLDEFAASSLDALLRHNGDGTWITQAFHESGFLTQAAVFRSGETGRGRKDLLVCVDLIGLVGTRQ